MKVLSPISGTVRDHPFIAASAVLVALVAAYFVAAAIAFSLRTHPSTEYALAFQETASEMPAVSFGDERAAEGALESLITAEKGRRERAERSDGAAPGPADVPGGAREPEWPDAVRAAFEYLRLASEGDPEAYRAWLDARGRRLFSSPPEHAFFTREFYEANLRYMAERVPGVRVDMDDFFDQYYYGVWRVLDGAYRPASLAADPRAIEVDVRRMEHWSAVPSFRVRPDGLGFQFWNGSGPGLPTMTLSVPDHAFSIGDDGQFIDPSLESLHETMRILYEPLLEGRSTLRMCQVKLVYRSQTDLNIPISFTFAAKPDGRWGLIGISIANVGKHYVNSQPILAYIPY